MSSYFNSPPRPVVDQNVAVLVGLGAVFLSLSIVSFAFRVWVRTRILACWGKDDWVMLVALACYVIMCGLSFQWATIEKHLASSMDSSTLVQSYNLFIASSAMYLVTVLFFKLSLALFFLRFIVERWARLTIFCVSSVFLVWTLANIFVTIFECGLPIDLLQKATTSQCLSVRTQFCLDITWAASHAATDWFFALVPVSLILKSRLSRAAKASAGIILAMAILGSSTVIPRIFDDRAIRESDDYWIVNTHFLSWNIGQSGLDLFAANIATLRPLLDRLLQTRNKKAAGVKLREKANEYSVGLKKPVLQPSSLESQPYMSGTGFYSGTSASSGHRPWENGMDFITAKTFDD